MNYSIKVDQIGAVAGALCLIHCIATPFVFIVKSCTAACCAETPFWWSLIDYLFLIISGFSIYKSTKTSQKQWVKIALWVNWVVLFFILMNERLEFFFLVKEAIYIPSILIVVLHIYNLKYCQCSKDSCCI